MSGSGKLDGTGRVRGRVGKAIDAGGRPGSARDHS